MEVNKELDDFEQAINLQNFMEFVIRLDLEYYDLKFAKFKECMEKVKYYLAARVGVELGQIFNLKNLVVGSDFKLEYYIKGVMLDTN